MAQKQTKKDPQTADSASPAKTAKRGKTAQSKGRATGNAAPEEARAEKKAVGRTAVRTPKTRVQGAETPRRARGMRLPLPAAGQAVTTYSRTGQAAAAGGL